MCHSIMNSRGKTRQRTGTKEAPNSTDFSGDLKKTKTLDYKTPSAAQ